MSDSTVLGLAGIAGTLAAGGLGLLSTWQLERRRERRDRQRRAIEILRAVRLIDQELGWNEVALKPTADNGGWWFHGMGPRLDAWSEHSPTVAGEISPSNWETLVVAAAAVRMILTLREDFERIDPGRDTFPWSDSIVKRFEEAREKLSTARVLLRPVNLGGTTFPVSEGGFWFPNVPELGPWDVWPERRWRKWQRRHPSSEQAATDESLSRDEIAPPLSSDEG